MVGGGRLWENGKTDAGLAGRPRPDVQVSQLVRFLPPPTSSTVPRQQLVAPDVPPAARPSRRPLPPRPSHAVTTASSDYRHQMSASSSQPAPRRLPPLGMSAPSSPDIYHRPSYPVVRTSSAASVVSLDEDLSRPPSRAPSSRSSPRLSPLQPTHNVHMPSLNSPSGSTHVLEVAPQPTVCGLPLKYVS